MSLHACIGYLVMVQGHPYSNDDPIPGDDFAYPAWMKWGVVILIGVGIGWWLKSGGYKKKE